MFAEDALTFGPSSSIVRLERHVAADNLSPDGEVLPGLAGIGNSNYNKEKAMDNAKETVDAGNALEGWSVFV